MRIWTETDTARLFDLYSREDVTQWLTSVPRPLRTIDEARALIAEWSEYNASDSRYGFWAIESSGGVVAGTVLLTPMEAHWPREEVTDGDVGWHLHPDSRGFGYATEAAAGAIAKGFGEGASTVFASVYSTNARSIAVCQRLHMEQLDRNSAGDGNTTWFRIRSPHAGMLGSPVPE
jgi:RimJ/RimL family protein N-acetyltransferase